MENILIGRGSLGSTISATSPLISILPALVVIPDIFRSFAHFVRLRNRMRLFLALTCNLRAGHGLTLSRCGALSVLFFPHFSEANEQGLKIDGLNGHLCLPINGDILFGLLVLRYLDGTCLSYKGDIAEIIADIQRRILDVDLHARVHISTRRNLAGHA